MVDLTGAIDDRQTSTERWSENQRTTIGSLSQAAVSLAELAEQPPSPAKPDTTGVAVAHG